MAVRSDSSDSADSDSSASSGARFSDSSGRARDTSNNRSFCCCVPKRRPAQPRKDRYVKEPVSQRDVSDDGLGGMGAAVAVVGLSWGNLPPARPDPRLDLRRYLRAGDLVNLLGGNVWGHCVLLLATPRAVEVPVLFEMDDAEEAKANGGRCMLKPIAKSVAVYFCKILQSASNMLSISVGPCALAVHPGSFEICVVKEMRGGVQICAGRKGPVTAEILMSPMKNVTIDFAQFNLAVEETYRATQDTKWSFTTAVRSYLRRAALRPGKYSRDDRKRALARSIGEKWQKRPICSTVPVRVWQKYLLKLSYKEAQRLPDPNNHTAPDPEVEWVRKILWMVPVKDDRVLPEELVKILLDTGVWSRVDFSMGLPGHRIDDAPLKEAEVFNQGYHPPSFRPFLPQNGLLNENGVICQLGADEFHFYCGQQFAKPQAMKARMANGGTATIQWDGRCGPIRGPQCGACRWLQDRLPNVPELPVRPRVPLQRPQGWIMQQFGRAAAALLQPRPGPSVPTPAAPPMGQALVPGTAY